MTDGGTGCSPSQRTATAWRAPARGTRLAEPNSGGASSNNPNRASSRSAERSVGSVSWLVGECAGSVKQKADSFGFAPGGEAEPAPGAGECRVRQTSGGDGISHRKASSAL
jgi:hypothetical protein